MVSFDNCVHVCNYHPRQDMEFSLMYLFQLIPPARGNHCSDFSHHRLVLPDLELSINRIIWNEFFCP